MAALDAADATNRQLLVAAVRDYFAALERLRAAFTSAPAPAAAPAAGTPMVSSESRDPRAQAAVQRQNAERGLILTQFLDVADRFRTLGFVRGQFWTLSTSRNLDGWAGAREKLADTLANQLGDELSLVPKRPYTEASLAMAERLGLPLRQVNVLQELGGNLVYLARQTKPADAAKLEQAARYFERVRTLLRTIPPLESVNNFLYPSRTPRSAGLILPQLWGIYLSLNRAAEAQPLIAEALEIARPFGEGALQSTLGEFALRANQADLDWDQRHSIIDAARVLGPGMELWTTRQLCGSSTGFQADRAEKTLAVAVALPDPRERAVTLEWYSRHRLEAEYQMIVNPGRYTPSQVEAIEKHPFPLAFDQLLALCLTSDEVELTADAMGHQAVFQATTAHGAEAVATFNHAIQFAERAGAFRKAAQLANRAAAPIPGDKVLGLSRAEFLGRAVAAATKANDALELAKALRARALNLSVGATNQGFEDLQRAVSAAERYTAESGDPAEEVRCLQALGNEHVLRGEYEAAVGVLERGAERAKSVSALSSNPSILERIAHIYAAYLGEPALAQEAAERTRQFIMNSPAVRAAGPPGSPNPNVERANVSLAALYRDVGQPAAALDAYARGLASYGGGPNWLPNQRMLLRDRAQYLTELGDYEGALSDWDEVLKLIPATLRNFYGGSEPIHRGVWAAEVARVHAQAGNLEKAVPLAMEAVAQFNQDTLGVWIGLGIVNSVVDILLGTDHPSEAIAFCEGYFKKVMKRPVADPVVERAYLEIAARAHVRAARFDRARTLLLSAIEIDRKHPTAEAGGLGGSLLALGRLELEAGNYATAKEHLVAARAAINPYDRDRIWQIERALAQVLLRLNDAASAQSHYEDALDALESVRGRLRPEEFRLKYNVERTNLYEEYASLVASRAIQSGSQRDAGAAFGAAERKRTQILWSLLATGWSRMAPDAVPDQVRRVVTLETRIAAKQAVLSEQLNQPSDKRNSALVDALRTDLRKIQGEHTQLLSAIAQGQYRYAAPTTLATGLAGPVRAALGPSQVLIEYLVADDRSYAFVVSRTGVTVVPLSIDRETLRKQVRQLLMPFRQLRAGEVDLSRLSFDTSAAFALYQAIFAPIRPALGSATDLLVVPDDALNFLPFDALVERAPQRGARAPVLHAELAGEAFLVRRFTITYLTSSAQLLPKAGAPVGQAPQWLLALANPAAGRVVPPASQDDPFRRQLRSGRYDGYFTPLPGTDAEVRRIAPPGSKRAATILTGSAATEAAYETQAGKHAVIHFATHGIAWDGQPLYSTMILAPDTSTGDDGLLQAYEVLRTPLNADLVVLSGCETALGADGYGEGLVGLVAAFEQAGAKSVLATLWSIDESTAEVMAAFYGAMAEGRGTPAALRQAKLQMLQRRLRIGPAEVSLAHPFFWAPFILVGSR